jgi:hypothetical protein
MISSREIMPTSRRLPSRTGKLRAFRLTISRRTRHGLHLPRHISTDRAVEEAIHRVVGPFANLHDPVPSLDGRFMPHGVGT